MTDDWQTPKLRQSVVSKINDMLQNTGSDPSKNASVMENHIYKKARTKEEYLGLVAKLFLHFKEMVNRGPAGKPQQPPNPDMGNANVMQDPLNTLQMLASQSKPLELTPNGIVQENKKETTDSTKSHEETNWKQWIPTARKKKISPYLKKSPKFPITSNVKEKFEDLDDASLVLVQLQIEASKLDLKNKKAEHDLYMSQKQEEHDIKLQHLFNEDKRKEEEHMLRMEQIRNQK